MIIHLAACPGEADFMQELLEPNVIGVYHLMESARKQDVDRIVMTSSCQVNQGTNWTERMITIDEPPVPKGHYAVTKLMAETGSRHYVQKHGTSIIVVRPGACVTAVQAPPHEVTAGTGRSSAVPTSAPLHCV